MPWLVLRMTAWAFARPTMPTTEVRGQWWQPVLHLPREVRVDEEAQEDVEVCLGDGQEGKRAGFKIGWDRVRGLQDEDHGVAVSFWMTDTGQPEKEATLVALGHKFCESARRMKVTVHGLPSQGVVPGSGAGITGAGQGIRGPGVVSWGSADKGLESTEGQEFGGV